MKDKSKIVEDFSWLSQPSGSAISLWIWVAAGVLLLLLIVAAFFVFRKKKGHLPFLAPPAPHEIALRDLKELAAMLREDCDLEFVKRASGILRIYIQERFGIRAPHRSTEEFLIEARHSEALDENHQKLLAGFLSQCDLVKFARQRVVLPEMQRLLHAARYFVEQTAPRETPKLEVAK